MKVPMSLIPIFLYLLSGCSTTLLERPTMISTAAPAQSQAILSTNIVKGESCRNSFGIINLIQLQIGNTPPNIDEALLDALSKAQNANTLIDAKVTSHFLYAVLYGKTCIEIQGLPTHI